VVVVVVVVGEGPKRHSKESFASPLSIECTL
jgi:hypothetical protein